MKKESHTSQDHDRKHQQDHIAHNPRAVKDIPTREDSEPANISPATAEIIAKGHAHTNKSPLQHAFTEDKRVTARHEHTHHFTNRAGQGSK